MAPTIDELFDQVSPEPNTGCWLWVGLSCGEYGYVRVGSRRVPAHRAAYEATHGPIHPLKVVDHLCGEKLCINPAHLEEVTRSENVRRGQPQGGNGRGRFKALRQGKTNRTLMQPIRLTKDEKELLEEAATMEGVGVSTWLRLLGLAAAKRTLGLPGRVTEWDPGAVLDEDEPRTQAGGSP